MAKAQVDGYTPRLKKHYEEVVRPKLIEEFGYKNPMEVPTIDKIVLNMGVGESTADSKKATVAAADLALIAGQKPVITKARKAIDGRGNYAMGIKEHLVFPEINYDRVEQVWGMDVIIATTAKTDEEARALLRHFNFTSRL